MASGKSNLCTSPWLLLYQLREIHRDTHYRSNFICTRPSIALFTVTRKNGQDSTRVCTRHDVKATPTSGIAHDVNNQWRVIMRFQQTEQCCSSSPDIWSVWFCRTHSWSKMASLLGSKSREKLRQEILDKLNGNPCYNEADSFLKLLFSKSSTQKQTQQDREQAER